MTTCSTTLSHDIVVVCSMKRRQVAAGRVLITAPCAKFPLRPGDPALVLIRYCRTGRNRGSTCGNPAASQAYGADTPADGPVWRTIFCKGSPSGAVALQQRGSCCREVRQCCEEDPTRVEAFQRAGPYGVEVAPGVRSEPRGGVHHVALI